MSPAFQAFFFREHPALVHVPLGLALCLPLLVAASLLSRDPAAWRRMAFRLTLLALATSSLALISGLGWGRLLALIPSHGFLPVAAGQGPALPRILRLHALIALAGFGLGLLCLLLLRASYRAPAQRGLAIVGLLCALAWAGAWGFVGKLGGIMVFGDPETNRAAAAALDASRHDREAELPIRALDFASLEPLQATPFRSRQHGGRLARTWVTASGLDELTQGRALPTGAYAVMSTCVDAAGTPGPLYLREAKADGTQAFAFYWPRVPGSALKETAGEDYVYWRSPHPALARCAGCHGGTARR